MTAVEKLLPEIYETLLNLRYPGIVQANCEDIKETILGRENRLFLLSWLLAQSSVAKSDEFTTNTDESKIIKWYSNMGICNNPDALMGKIPMQDQIDTLKNLLFFSKNALLADQSNDITADEQSRINDTFNKRMSKTVNIIPSTCSFGSKLNYTEAVQYLKKCKKTLGDRENSNAEGTLVKNDESMKKNYESMKKNDESIKNNDGSNEIFGSKEDNDSRSQESDRQAVVEKFVQAFDSVSNWPKPKTADSTLTTKKSMDNHIDNIHSNMTTLKVRLRSKDEITNFVMMEELKKPEMPLDDVIEDIVICIEEVIRLRNE